MDTEEVVIKMGFDAHGVSEGAQKMSAVMGQTSDHVAEHFVHAESQGKAFKKLLHEITDISPLMGGAFRLAMDPISGIMIALVSGMKMVHKAFEDAEKFTEKMAEKEAKHQATIEEANSKAAEAISKRKEAHEDFESKRAKSDAEGQKRAEYERRISDAKEASGGDEGEFLAKKKLIDLEEKRRIESKAADAEKRNADAERFADTQSQIQAGEILKQRVKELAAEEEKANKELAVLSSHNPLEIGGTPLFTSGIKHQEKVIEAQNRAIAVREQRESVEESLRIGEERQKQNTARQKEAQAELLKAPNELRSIEKELADDDRKLIEEERKQRHDATQQAIKEAKERAEFNEVTFLKQKIQIEQSASIEAEAHNDKVEQKNLEKQLIVDGLKLKEAESEQARHQAKFDRDYSHEKRKRDETARQPYLPTLQALANSMAWHPDIIDQAQRRMDAATMGMGTAFGQRFAPQAQELLKLQDDAKRALFIEGPESRRFKDDVQRIDSLKKGLAAAGLQTSDDKLESIDNHMKDLVDRASKEGLVVQPINAP